MGDRARRETPALATRSSFSGTDQLADGIAVIDHGKAIAEGTPGQLKASVGSGALHVRLLDPEERPEAEQILSHELGTVTLEPESAALSVSCADVNRAADAVAELTRSGVGIAPM